MEPWACGALRRRNTDGCWRARSDADSWSTDGHKWLNVPYDCGYAFVRDAAAHYASQSVHSSYLVQGAGARDQVDWTPEFSRRGRGFATYAALRQLGRDGVAELIDRCCVITKELVERIGCAARSEGVVRSTH